MNLEGFLARLKQGRKSGSGWMALCPAHADRNPSLSLREGDSGGILIHCHAGCKAEDVTAALGLTLRDLAPESRIVAARSVTVKSSRTVTPYEIRNRLGDVLAIHERSDKAGGKGFIWRRPSGEPGLGGMKATDLPLFGVELLDGEDGPVFVCEGEKAALALRSLGALALGTYGAEVIPSVEALADLRGRHVVLWPDRDSIGLVHMARIKERLQGIAATVRVISWGTEEKDDAADFTARGGKREDLEHLLASSSSSVPEEQVLKGSARPETLPSIPFTRIGDLLREPDPDYRWIVEGRLQVGGVSLLVAKPKAGKSTLARWLSLAVTRGEPWLGHQTTRGPVAYCGFEEIRSEVKRHFAAMGANESDDLFVVAGQPSLDFLELLKEWIAEKRPALVVLDGLFRLIRVMDANDYAKMSRALEPIIGVARHGGAHLLATHHSPKSERGGGDDVLGSTAIFGSVDTLLQIRRSERGERTLSTVQRYGGSLEETLLTLDAEGRSQLGASREGAEIERLSTAIEDVLKGASAEGMTEEAIHEETEGRTAGKRRALRVLLASGDILRSGTGRKGSPFLYRLREIAEGDSNSRFLVPTIGTERENEKGIPKGDPAAEPHAPRD